MRKLTKEAMAERDALQPKFDKAFEALLDTVQAFNTLMEQQWETVTQAVETYNAVVQEGREWVGEQTSDMEQFQLERSERWLESDAGQRYAAWIQQFETVDLRDVELEAPATLELELDGDKYAELENLAISPEEL